MGDLDLRGANLYASSPDHYRAARLEVSPTIGRDCLAWAVAVAGSVDAGDGFCAFQQISM
jgi:hypothetical protein